MTTTRNQGETNYSRNALVEEERIHGKATGQDAATNSKHPAPDISLSLSVRRKRRKRIGDGLHLKASIQHNGRDR